MNSSNINKSKAKKETYVIDKPSFYLPCSQHYSIGNNVTINKQDEENFYQLHGSESTRRFYLFLNTIDQLFSQLANIINIRKVKPSKHTAGQQDKLPAVSKGQQS